jgi:hypothetical protein
VAAEYEWSIYERGSDKKKEEGEYPTDHRGDASGVRAGQDGVLRVGRNIITLAVLVGGS